MSIWPHQANQATYYVQAIDDFGCEETAILEVGSYPVSINYNDLSTFCIRDTIDLEVVNLDPSQNLSFAWTPGTEILAGQGTNQITVSPTVDQVYEFTAVNQYNCTESGQISVSVFDFTPPLTATATPDTIIQGESSQLMATDDPGYTYQWTPAGSLDDPTVADPIATPDETTTYEVFH